VKVDVSIPLAAFARRPRAANDAAAKIALVDILLSPYSKFLLYKHGQLLSKVYASPIKSTNAVFVFFLRSSSTWCYGERAPSRGLANKWSARCTIVLRAQLDKSEIEWFESSRVLLYMGTHVN